MIQTSKDEIHKEVIFKNRKIPLRYGIIDLNRTITGYLKGNYNETVDKFETLTDVFEFSSSAFAGSTGHTLVFGYSNIFFA